MDKNVSIDQAALNSWCFQDINGFVVKDYTTVDEEHPDPMIYVVRAHEIFDVIADATKNEKKIAAYAIGKCVYDAT